MSFLINQSYYLKAQGPIHENFGGNCSAFGEVEKLSFFESAISNLFQMLHPHENKSQIMCYNGWDSIFIIMMVYSQKWARES